MSNKFSNVPVDDDTKILFQTEASLGEYEVLYQKWIWDGITAESIIFDVNDVANLTDVDLENEVRTSPLLKEDTKVTISRKAYGFVFTNFNFVS